jgi:hypothetical protein
LQNLSLESFLLTSLSTLNQKEANMALEQRNARTEGTVRQRDREVDEVPDAEQDVEMEESGGYAW